jgi:hypothetical protein
MSMHIQRFVDRVQGADSRGQKDLVMSLADAKNLHADITRLLVELENSRKHDLNGTKDDVIQVQVSGGSF